jgi:hypothetical protein
MVIRKVGKKSKKGTIKTTKLLNIIGFFVTAGGTDGIAHQAVSGYRTL